MATKSKNIKYSYGLKTLAFMLAAALVFAGAWLCGGLVNILNDLGWDNTMVREDPVFTDTALFQNQVNAASGYVFTACVQNDWTRDALPNYPTLAEAQEKAEKTRQLLREDVYWSLVNSAQAAYDEPVTAADGAPAYTPTEEELEAAYPAASTTSPLGMGNESAQVYISADMTAEALAADVEQIYTSTLNWEQRNFRARVLRAEEALASLQNFRYLLVDAATGETMTNLANVKTPDDFFAACGERDWFVGYTVDSGLERYSGAASSMVFDAADPEKSGQYVTQWLDAFAENGYDVYFCVPEALAAGDAFSDALATFSESSAQIDRQTVGLVVALSAALALSVYLLLTAGRVKGRDDVQFLPQDRLPGDVHTLLSAALAVALLIGAFYFMGHYISDDGTSYQIRSVSLWRVAAGLCAAGLYAVLAEWVLSVAKYAKSDRPYFASMLLVRAARRLSRIVRAGLARPKHISRKAVVFAALYLFINLLLLSIGGAGSLLVALVWNVLAFLLVWRYLSSLDRILDAAEAGKRGDAPKPMDTARMPEPLGTLARNLTVTQAEMHKAVQEAVKNERMKAELITNVSHDLKTPLTSIISYVDLLKKCEISDPDAQSYLGVLDEKSTRLKRLIEDLVEASKASSGAVTLHKMHVNLYELAVQAVGELEDSFAERNLQIVLDAPKTPPVVFADSQKTWRVIDNLLSNARKYSLPGSRVYVDVFPDGTDGVFCIKNISGEPLNIDPEELTQRFVRGDASRTLEGSGLGLSIAKDLCALQGGRLQLEIDGDLFKATVRLPLSGSARTTPAPPQETPADAPGADAALPAPAPAETPAKAPVETPGDTPAER